MKKLLLQLLLAALLGVSGTAFGQGTVNFGNTGNPAFRIWTNNLQGTASNLITSANPFRFGLYVSTNLAASEASLELVGLATNGASGFFSGGNAFALPDGFASGTAIRFQIRAWTLAAGSTYEEAVLAGYAAPGTLVGGVSVVGQTTLGGIPGALFGTGPGQIIGIELHPIPIPEPSSVALGTLGLAALSLVRRRKPSKKFLL